MPFVIFGIIRIGVGASIFGTLDKVKLGAWWVGVVMFITAFTQFRIYSRLVTTLISIIIALAGAILDGRGVGQFSSITACASLHSTTVSAIELYGQPLDYLLAESCLNNTAVFVPDGCYCVSGIKGPCNQYSLSTTSVKAGKDCFYLMTTYPTMLIISCAFCCLCLIAALIRLYICYVTWNYKHDD